MHGFHRNQAYICIPAMGNGTLLICIQAYCDLTFNGSDLRSTTVYVNLPPVSMHVNMISTWIRYAVVIRLKVRSSRISIVLFILIGRENGNDYAGGTNTPASGRR